MYYNISLIFDEETNSQIKQYYNQIREGLNVEGELNENSIPHITVIKFESPKELSKEYLDSVLQGVQKEINVEFSGITLLPSKNRGGTWIEISILKTNELIKMQEELIKRVKDFEITNSINERFRPHTTLCKIKDTNFKVSNLDKKILRKNNVKCKLFILEYK